MEHVLKGWRVWQIAKALKVDRSTVYRDITARLETLAANCPHTNNYRQLQRERISALMVRYMQAALEGDLRAFDRVLKLMGLYKPIRHELTANVTGKPEWMPFHDRRGRLEEFELNMDMAAETAAAGDGGR